MVRIPAADYWTGWRNTWRRSITVQPLEGRRGSGRYAGAIGLASFPAGTYPSCSHHGAMVCVKGATVEVASYWRCLVEGCNIGCQWQKRRVGT